MKKFNKNSQKLRHGSLTVGLTAAVIAVVLVLNVAATALLSHFHIFLDMSPESYYTMSAEGDHTQRTTTMYTLMPETVYLLERSFEEINAARANEGLEPVKVDITFCADPDMLIKNRDMRYVYYTALSLQRAFPDSIRVKTTNVWTNPSSVDDYRTNAYSQIYQTNIIVSSGTEFRIATTRSFYVYSEYGDVTPWAYHGEKNFVSYILAVTQAESPICCLTTNHGEPDTQAEGSEYAEFRRLLENVGYAVYDLDLEKDPIPENCRLIITLDPQKDFTANYRDPNASSEIKKLQEYLAKSYSYMIFAGADTPKLPILEEFLEEWGIAFERYDGEVDGAIFEISDPTSSLDSKSQATNLIGEYEVDAPAAAWTEDMREFGAFPKVIFGDAIGIRYSDSYTPYYQINEDDRTVEYTYGWYSSNGYNRQMYDIFKTSKDATAYVVKNGERLTDAEGNPLVYSAAPFRLMTVTSEDNRIGEGSGFTSATESAYVCAVGSVRMVTNDMLQSDTYGNTDALLSVLRSMGREIEPVGLNLKVSHQEPFDQDVVGTYSPAAWTVVLTLLPVLCFAAAGVFVLVRRKTRH